MKRLSIFFLLSLLSLLSLSPCVLLALLARGRVKFAGKLVGEKINHEGA